MDKKQISDESAKKRNDETFSEERSPLRIPAQYDESEQWVQEYKEQFGTEPSFF